MVLREAAWVIKLWRDGEILSVSYVKAVRGPGRRMERALTLLHGKPNGQDLWRVHEADNSSIVSDRLLCLQTSPAVISLLSKRYQ